MASFIPINVYSVYKKIVRKIKLGDCHAGIFCDRSRALDCVNQRILLTELCGHGVTLDWFGLYLSGRKQCVSVMDSRGKTLKEISAEHGVPQSSIFGPMYFIIMYRYRGS